MVADIGDGLGSLLAALPAGYVLRVRADADLPFLCSLYAQTREDELRPVPWTAQQKVDFLADQFGKQHAHYLQHYPRAHWWIVMCGEEAAGRIYVDQTGAELRIMDISLAAPHRGRGLGSALIRAVLNHADAQRLPATLHVEPFNPALRLYERFGFIRMETRGVYYFMRRQPAAPSIEDDLVARPGGVAANGHQEQVEPSVRRME
jgi:ribosomal protein S18 acetylase RimI-like enzyme